MELAHISHQLSSSPTRFPNYCLAISNTLVAQLIALLPEKPAFTLSVGSGSGLLEALITYQQSNLSVQGVEVDSTINRYIAEEEMHTVGGGWSLHADAQQATAWMFVYPRDPKLITRYIDTYGDQAVEIIIWLGPRMDWAEYEPCFRGSSFSTLSFLDDGSLTSYETMVVAQK